jgi:hypothetical protein
MPCPRRYAPLLASAAACLAAAGCSHEALTAVYPEADLRPPALLEAGPTGSRTFLLRFDEAVTPVEGSLASEPRADLGCRSEAESLVVEFASDQSPGADYALSGEVEDPCGNRTRFLVRFAGWNDRAPKLRLSEVQTGKNSSKTNPHRDFVELEVLADGNVGGEELSWASSVKTATYRFPGIEVKKGDFLVLHLAPEGIAAEVDELGSDLSASGGIDAGAAGRDLWCAAMGLPDASGALALAIRPGSPPIDGLFYADDTKTGALAESKLTEMLAALSSAGAWPLSGAAPTWADGVQWSGSTAKSMCRSLPGAGPASWYVGAAGAQSPGAANSAPPSAAPAAKASVAEALAARAVTGKSKAVKAVKVRSR